MNRSCGRMPDVRRACVLDADRVPIGRFGVIDREETPHQSWEWFDSPWPDRPFRLEPAPLELEPDPDVSDVYPMPRRLTARFDREGLPLRRAYDVAVDGGPRLGCLLVTDAALYWSPCCEARFDRMASLPLCFDPRPLDADLPTPGEVFVQHPLTLGGSSGPWPRLR